MTSEQIEDYKKTAKVGDRFFHPAYKYLVYVRGVENRGVVTSLREKTPDHQSLYEWEYLVRWDLVHKEP